MTKLILVIGNEEALGDGDIQWGKFRKVLQATGHGSLLLSNGQDGLDFVSKDDGADVGLVLLHMDLPDLDALTVLSEFKKLYPHLPVIILTTQASVTMAVEAMRVGAYDFIVSPVEETRLINSIEKGLKHHRDLAGHPSLPEENSGQGFENLIGDSPVMREVVALAKKGAKTSVPILLEGESGAGKEVFARAIQDASERRKRPFIVVNCGAIPANLVESLLFGHEQGAFTGASEKHSGKFLEAHGGTLFLDEIGELPRDVQVKLLRVLQEGEVEPVGARHCIKVDVRLISATNKSLQDLVNIGEFREDLLYRLNVFPILLPALRHRQGDVVKLARRLTHSISLSEGLPLKEISPDALDLLQSYSWPGNVRQLENVLSRAVILSEGNLIQSDDFSQIQAALLQNKSGTSDSSVQNISLGKNNSPISTLDQSGEIRQICDVEAEMIDYAISKYEGCMSEIARRLGIGRSTLYRKVAEYKLENEG